MSRAEHRPMPWGCLLGLLSLPVTLWHRVPQTYPEKTPCGEHCTPRRHCGRPCCHDDLW
jgi:hypothetical protein